MLTTAGLLLCAVLLFLIALRVSALFSGSETGFYRLSRIRLSIESKRGSTVAEQLLWFSRRPEQFVATTLVGNNIANYLATVAVGLAAAALTEGESGTTEILLTLLAAPIVFIWGELIPKTVFYRAPLKFLGKHSVALAMWYRILTPVTKPLTLVARLVERFTRSEKQPEFVLGRNRLVHVLHQGHREGLLSEVQSRMLENVMEIAATPIRSSVIPQARIVGCPDTATAQDVLETARAYSLSHVPVHRAADSDDWYACVRTADLLDADGDLPLRKILQLPAGTPKLTALQELRRNRAFFAAVTEQNSVVGLVTNAGLTAQLFRPPQPPTESGR